MTEPTETTCDTGRAAGARAHAPLHRATPAVGWARSAGLVGYPEAVAVMEARADAIRRGEAGELVWLLEHPPLYTSGTSARAEHLVDPGRFAVYPTRRGGQFTYHGPGQRVAYVMLDVAARGRDVRGFVGGLENWVIGALDRFGVTGELRCGRVGVWVARPAPTGGPQREDKIAAIGVRLKRWVSLHGMALNVAPDLSHYAGIVPCGISEHGVTSLADLGVGASIEAVDNELRRTFETIFGPTIDVEAPF